MNSDLKGVFKGPALFLTLVYLVFAGLVTGCDEASLKDGGLKFKHEPHLAMDVACADCHGASGGGKLPEVEACGTCHEEAMELAKDRKLTPDDVKKIVMSAKGKAPAANNWGLSFDHAKHNDVKCGECHSTPDKKSVMRPAMKTCLDLCHGEGKEAALDCAKCHSELNAKGEPKDHTAGWSGGVHGEKAYANPADCRQCHEEKKCFTCHQTKKPKNHNQQWRLRGHGVVAQMRREGCVTCHNADYCTRCHKMTRPISHVNSFLRGRYNHCNSCHLPLSGNNQCAACHDAANHTSAPAWPVNVTHVTGADCRSCHIGPGNKLEHFDNGDNCESCHAK